MQETQVVTSTPSEPVATPAVAEPTGAGTGTGQIVNGDANGQGAPVEETFLSSDPNTLPPQLRDSYLKMLRDYKEKTSKLADERKRYDGFDDFKKKADLFDQLSQDQRFVNYWQSLTNEQQKEQAKDEGITQEEWLEAQSDPAKWEALVHKIAESRNEELKRKTMELETKQLRSDATEIVDAFADAMDKKTGQKLRPDFDELSSRGLIGFFLEQNPPKTREEWERAIQDSYVKAKNLYTDIYNKGKSEAHGQMQTKIANSTERPSVSSGDVYTYDPNKLLSVSESVALARKGIRIQR